MCLILFCSSSFLSVVGNLWTQGCCARLYMGYQLFWSMGCGARKGTTSTSLVHSVYMLPNICFVLNTPTLLFYNELTAVISYTSEKPTQCIPEEGRINWRIQFQHQNNVIKIFRGKELLYILQVFYIVVFVTLRIFSFAGELRYPCWSSYCSTQDLTA